MIEELILLLHLWFQGVFKKFVPHEISDHFFKTQKSQKDEI